MIRPACFALRPVDRKNVAPPVASSIGISQSQRKRQHLDQQRRSQISPKSLGQTFTKSKRCIARESRNHQTHRSRAL